MTKHIGTIIDKSYYQEFFRVKGNRNYYFSICPICQEELEQGFSDLDGSSRTAVLPHICEKFQEFAELLGTRHLPKAEFEWGQFMFVTHPK